MKKSSQNTLLALLCLGFLAVNLATGTRSPTVWIDEISLTEPAANLLLEGRFRSSASTQPSAAFFADTVPLYPLVLFAWLRIFGLGVLQVRSLSYAMMAGVLMALYHLTTRRRQLIRSPHLCLLLLLAVACGDGVTYSYRTGRWDVLGMCVGVAMAWAATLSSRRARCGLLALSAALIPWTSVSLGIYVACLGLLVLLISRGSLWREVGAVALGGIAGSLLLVALYATQGVLDQFMDAVFARSGPRALRSTLASRLLVDSLRDPSRVVLSAAFLLALFCRPKGQRLRLTSPPVLGLIVVLVLPVLLSVLRTFSRYYSWMAYIPAVFILGIEIESARERRARVVPVYFLLLAAACAVGLPARLAVVLVEWRERDYRPVEAFVESRLRPDDVAYIEYAYYYPAKRTAAEVYFKYHAFTAEEKASLTVLVVSSEKAPPRMSVFDREWELTARRPPGSVNPLRRWVPRIGARLYPVAVYRPTPLPDTPLPDGPGGLS